MKKETAPESSGAALHAFNVARKLRDLRNWPAAEPHGKANPAEAEHHHRPGRRFGNCEGPDGAGDWHIVIAVGQAQAMKPQLERPFVRQEEMGRFVEVDVHTA